MGNAEWARIFSLQMVIDNLTVKSDEWGGRTLACKTP
jgi:hypothetical protein